MRHVFLAAALASAAAAPAGADTPRLLAVLPLDATSVKLEPSAREAIEETLRTSAGDVLRGYGYTVLAGENTLTILSDNGIDPLTACEASCALEAARQIKASLFVSGRVTRVEDAFIAFLRLSEVARGQQLASLQVEAGSVRELRMQVANRAVELFAVLRRSARPAQADGPREVSTAAVVPLGDIVDERGIVEFTSTPADAVVRLDDVLLCKSTPCRKNVPLGPHVVTMELERYFPATQSLVLTKDQTVKLALQPTFGTLELRTIPPTLKVALNGKDQGRGPFELEPDAYELVVTDECYTPERKSVLVEQGRTVNVQLVAKARLAAIEVSAADERGDALEAAVSVDGEVLGESPGTFKVPICSQTLTVRADDGRSARKSLDLVEGEKTSLELVVRGARNAPPERADGSELPPGVLEPVGAVRVSPWVLVSGALGVATWAACGIAARSTHAELRALPPGDPTIPGRIATGESLVVGANIGAVVTAAAVVVGYFQQNARP